MIDDMCGLSQYARRMGTAYTWNAAYVYMNTDNILQYGLARDETIPQESFL